MRYQYLLFISFLLLLSNCTNSEDDNTDRTKLVLTEPSNDAAVSHCCNVFRWNPIPSERQYRFQLTTEQTFDTILIDRLVEADSVLVDYLDPSLTYYWKVTSEYNNLISEVFSFSGIDYSELYGGDYSGTQTVYSYHFADGLVVTIDTTYTSTINIQSTLDGNFIINDEEFDYKPSFVENIIKLGLPTNWDDNGKNATINLDSGSLVFTHGVYGGGGGYTSTTTALLK